jgi:hypothetical protein
MQQTFTIITVVMISTNNSSDAEIVAVEDIRRRDNDGPRGVPMIDAVQHIRRRKEQRGSLLLRSIY